MLPTYSLQFQMNWRTGGTLSAHPNPPQRKTNGIQQKLVNINTEVNIKLVKPSAVNIILDSFPANVTVGVGAQH